MNESVKKIKLHKYVCKNPFTYIDVQPSNDWICCPSWCPTSITQGNTRSRNEEELPHNSWKSENINLIRQSVLDGTYQYCKHHICPSLTRLIHTDNVDENFIEKSQFYHKFNITSLEDISNFKGLPETILFGFDRSCNLKCPSCRLDFVPNDSVDSAEYQTKLKILNSIETYFSSNVKELIITGSGDPFYSKIYRDYLINFKSSLYPNLERINIITNGVLLTEKMWNSLNSKEFIKFIEISMDAGTKTTYEEVTRLNGDWDKLIDNIKFLSTVSSIKNMVFSMVVSKHNYHEMKTFYDLISKIFESSHIQWAIHYRQIVHWGLGAYSIEDIDQLSIFNPQHPEFSKFLFEVERVYKLPFVNHNFYNFIRSHLPS